MVEKRITYRYQNRGKMYLRSAKFFRKSQKTKFAYLTAMFLYKFCTWLKRESLVDIRNVKKNICVVQIFFSNHEKPNLHTQVLSFIFKIFTSFKRVSLLDIRDAKNIFECCKYFQLIAKKKIIIMARLVLMAEKGITYRYQIRKEMYELTSKFANFKKPNSYLFFFSNKKNEVKK